MGNSDLGNSVNSAVVMLLIGYDLFCSTDPLMKKSAPGYQLVFSTSEFSVLILSQLNSLANSRFLFLKNLECKSARANSSNFCCCLCRMSIELLWSIACSKVWGLWRNWSASKLTTSITAKLPTNADVLLSWSFNVK